MKKVLLAIAILATCISAFTAAYANSAMPPGITVEIVNAPDDLECDILVDNLDIYDRNSEKFTDDKLADNALYKLYNYNKDGYLAYGVRNQGEFYGYYKSYYDGKYSIDASFYSESSNPDNFKVITVDSDGSIIVSNNAQYIGYRKGYTYDYDTNELHRNRKLDIHNPILEVLLAIVAGLFVALAITIVLEVIVALIMKFPVIPVLKVNCITNIIMNILLFVTVYIFNSGGYLISLIALEALVILVEVRLYIKMLQKLDRRIGKYKIVMYTVVANVVSLMLPIVFYLIEVM